MQRHAQIGYDYQTLEKIDNATKRLYGEENNVLPLVLTAMLSIFRRPRRRNCW